MKLNIQTDGLCLSVSDRLVQLLREQAEKKVVVDDADAITFNFRDPNYNAEDGGYHPVEIRVARQGEAFRLEYITDFSYVGNGWDVELAKEIDFDILWGKCEVRYLPPMDLADATEFYLTFEENFLGYWEMGVFEVEVAIQD